MTIKEAKKLLDTWNSMPSDADNAYIDQLIEAGKMVGREEGREEQREKALETKPSKKITKLSTVTELLEYITACEDAAGEACNASDGTQGCEEANAMQFLYQQISNLLQGDPDSQQNISSNQK